MKKDSNDVHLTVSSKTVDLRNLDQKFIDKVKNIFMDYEKLTKKYPSFYTTIFLNQEGYKLSFYFSNKHCTKVTLNEIGIDVKDL